MNGATVIRVPRERVEYWHVELDSHDIIVAEGLAAESYLDNGNRTSFINGGGFIEAHPDFKARHWSETCRPLIFEGRALQTAKASLLTRTRELGHALTDDAELYAIADGKRLAPIRLGEHIWAFVMSTQSSVFQIRCRIFVCAHVDASSTDPRALGLCVSRLQLDGADVDLDDALFAHGWHELERDSEGRRFRWSQGCIPLPATTRLVVLETCERGYFWATSADEAVRLRTPSV